MAEGSLLAATMVMAAMVVAFLLAATTGVGATVVATMEVPTTLRAMTATTDTFGIRRAAAIAGSCAMKRTSFLLMKAVITDQLGNSLKALEPTRLIREADMVAG